ncbi:MBL fold metallo-hydrolase [Thalassococcus sp. BH17M4-6]|uniref:MBL fold metallo-hydrolase n=1 Tax=Thalassococcus sp. BH17M4-6 TaxID=3413148 RepID=UPI003BD59A79
MPAFTPSRRTLLRMAAAMPALTLPVTAYSAQLGAPAGPNPTYMRFTLGQAKMTVISDGSLSLPVSGIGVNADPAEVQAFLTAHFLSPETNYAHTNHLLIELGEAKVLVDVGSGNRFLDTAGRLMANLDAAGVDPDSITHVVITHAHPDHIWGIRDDFDEAILPDAQKFIGAAERDFWMQDDLVNQVPQDMQQFVLGAVNSITVDGAEWTLLADGDEVAPGIRVIDTPGHTPGHMSVVVESDGQQLLAIGDALSHAYLSFARPDWYNEFDMDGDQTVATRARLLDMAAADRMAVIGYHFPFPGVGHVMREGDAYRFIPALWTFES